MDARTAGEPTGIDSGSAVAAIDAHHHLWNYDPVAYSWIGDDMSVLRRDYTPQHLWQEMAAANVLGAIAVQARQSMHETQWLLDLAKECDYLIGVVGWVPLIDQNVSAHLERFSQSPKLRAVRHLLQDEPDQHYMLRTDFHHGIRKLRGFGLAYDLLIYERHLPQAIQLVDSFPNQTFVLDHLAKPRIRDRVMSPWTENLRDLARRPNVFCKLSGMVTEADWAAWTEADLLPYFDIALAAFTPSRLMFGTDWPVLQVAARYSQWTALVRRWVSRLTTSEQESILRTTALRAYRL